MHINKKRNKLFYGNNKETFYYIFNFGFEYKQKYHLYAGLKIIYENQKEKENIFVKITKLVDNIIKFNNYIAFETNITNIPSFDSFLFYLKFSLLNDQTKFDQLCFLKKNNDNSTLMLLCQMNKNKEMNLVLNETDKLNLSDININYNFIMSYSNKEEIINIKGDGNFIQAEYPQILDFSSNDIINVTFYGSAKEITLNKDSNDLDCQINSKTTQCTVNKSHFKEKINEDYYIYHTNHLGRKSIFYEIPFKDIFNGDIKIIGLNFLFYFCFIFIFL